MTFASTKSTQYNVQLSQNIYVLHRFESEHVIGSVPINHKNPSISQFEAYRGKPLILIADVRGRQAADLAKQLIEAGYTEVALVHGGYDALRTVGGVKTEGTNNSS